MKRNLKLDNSEPRFAYRDRYLITQIALHECHSFGFSTQWLATVTEVFYGFPLVL